MEQPQYHLQSVVHAKQTLEDFDGPLDVILLLLSKNKIEIQDISISSILEQYLAWLDERKRMDMEVASEFIAMASHLMYIKTRMLLSEAEKAEGGVGDGRTHRVASPAAEKKDAYEQIKIAVNARSRSETTSDSACFPNSPSLCAGTRRTAISTTGRICWTRSPRCRTGHQRAPPPVFCRHRRRGAVSGGKKRPGSQTAHWARRDEILSLSREATAGRRSWRHLSVLGFAGSTRCALKTRTRRTGNRLRAETRRKDLSWEE